MKIENNFILGTASGIASVLCADFKEPISYKSASQFKECDFAPAPETWYSTDTVKEISNRAESWYGIKTINTDFDNPSIRTVRRLLRRLCWVLLCHRNRK